MKHLIIGTAGHIDHGKTSLIQLLSGIDCDTHKQEKERGITISLGFSHVGLPSGQVLGIIDVPGHKDLIDTMISGASSINLVLLVIAADEGIMPQTSEHLNIINALGIKHGIIVLSKIDLVDEELVEIAKSEIKDFVQNSILENSPIIGVSSHTGEGKDNLILELENFVKSYQETEFKDNFRMYIDRLFVVKGHGSVVTGSVLDGKLESGEEVFLLPSNSKKFRVRAMEKYGKPTEIVQKGDRAAINLIGLKQEDFTRGMLISKNEIVSTKLIDVYISSFDLVPTLKLWTDIIFISGTYQSMGKMHLIDKEKLFAGDDAIAQIHLEKDFVGEIKDRFIFRNSSDDISLGGGFVIDNQPLHHKRRNLELSQKLRNIATNLIQGNELESNILRIIEKEPRPFGIDEIVEKTLSSKEEILSEISNLSQNICVYNNEILIYSRFDKMFEDKIIAYLKDYHSVNYIFDTGMQSEEILGKFNLGKSNLVKDYLKNLLERLKENSLLDFYENTWILKNHKANIDQKTQSELDWLESEFLAYKDEKPVLLDIEEKASAKNISTKKYKLYLNYFVSKNILVVFNGEYMHSKIFIEAKHKLLNHLKTKENGIYIPEYKEVITGTKKFRGLISDILENQGLIKFIKDSNNESVLLITDRGKMI
ncbi:MAG: selenocysteine-specific translation elongation factor [Bacteroidota bacterium]|jgi:selenocysteine-specific elongation factor|nr:selenocysteine-specific translation elongation factor [Bacteroidales bacterium]MDI9535749.1 selenocysteine-specific translation elongation factor [Bacteroidota bacterium]OQC46847.1 MAG: Selenocysteine-specific elongation factor [Bacteroidetes bacterium ADurb.Bin028]NLP20554.1 selenocysteine-specific translation elongation factor [Bacteroidales bacterium]HNY43361.1 selenocysteine-specific translation elongation factor [Bacteroidales bacterium]